MTVVRVRFVLARAFLTLLPAACLAACDAGSRVTAPGAAVAPSLKVGTGKPYVAVLGTTDVPVGLVSSATAEITVNQGSGSICYRLSATMADPDVDFAWHSVVALDVSGVRKYLANEPLMIGPLVSGAASHLAEGCTTAAPELTSEHLRKLARSDARVTARFIAGNPMMSYVTGHMDGVLGR